MNITTILFDLDGTLLPMDQDVFVKAYFGSLAKKLAPCGYEPNKFIASIWEGVRAMVKNNGEVTNEAAFWEKFCEIHGEKAKLDEPVFKEFYETDFKNIKQVCGFSELSAKLIALIKQKGLRVALATNPIFPSIATESRIAWAGLSPSDFELYTTYENSRFCKPNPEYYKEILSKLNVTAEECLMVGNDVNEDMIAAELGMKVFLLTDCMINKSNKDISAYESGNMQQLIEYITANCK